MLFLIDGLGWIGGIADQRPRNRFLGRMEEKGSGNVALGAGLGEQCFLNA